MEHQEYLNNNRRRPSPSLISEKVKQLWQDPDFRKRAIDGRGNQKLRRKEKDIKYALEQLLKQNKILEGISVTEGMDTYTKVWLQFQIGVNYMNDLHEILPECDEDDIKYWMSKLFERGTLFATNLIPDNSRIKKVGKRMRILASFYPYLEILENTPASKKEYRLNGWKRLHEIGIDCPMCGSSFFDIFEKYYFCPCCHTKLLKPKNK